MTCFLSNRRSLAVAGVFLQVAAYFQGGRKFDLASAVNLRFFFYIFFLVKIDACC
jgi:hypothetical protein